MQMTSGMELKDVLQVIKNESIPTGDPGAWEDCWREVFETLTNAENPPA